MHAERNVSKLTGVCDTCRMMFVSTRLAGAKLGEEVVPRRTSLQKQESHRAARSLL